MLIAVAVTALFVATVVVAWAGRRRTRRPRKHRNHAPQLAFLVTTHGFDEPVGHLFSQETHYVFRRGADAVDIFWDAEDMGVRLTMRGRSTTVTRLSLEEIAAAIRAHPGILRGDFSSLDEAEKVAAA